MKIIQVQYYQSPYGELLLGSLDGKLCICDWMNKKRRALIDKKMQNKLQAVYEIENSEVITKAMKQLDEYFAHQRTTFDVPMYLVGTDFQKTVWLELLNIPYGTTVSYAELSQKIDHSKAVRAVGAANGANPISIFVPCHRVIGSDHKLTGYGGGIAVKKMLLDLESRNSNHC